MSSTNWSIFRENRPQVILQAEAASSPLCAMSSTEPAKPDHCPGSTASSCGLVGTLFPTSCRGRAEAFARRLHRRLTSLSGTENNTCNPTETSWLHTTNHHLEKSSRVHDSQPRHSPESDLYYDFNFPEHFSEHFPEHFPGDAQDPGSPEEVVSAAEFANLLVNTSKLLKCHEPCTCQKHVEDSQDRESSGYVFSSPLDGATPSDSDAYYDPESSDKTRTDDFFDPITSSSDILSNGDMPHIHKPPGRRRETSVNGHQDTSEESSLSNGIKEPRIQAIRIANSSDESLEVASSLETTSPSHESLWSTFDESTVSLQDDVSFASSAPTETRFLKSHSDSEIIPGVMKMAAIDLESIGPDEVDHVANDVNWKEEREETINYCNGDKCVVEESNTKGESEDHSTYSSTFNIPGALEVECPNVKSNLDETLTTQVNMTIGEGEEVSRLLKKLSCSPRGSFESDREELESPEGCEEDERPQRVRRCSSLKTGKTPPGTPGRKKIVRFADVLGLDLADVRTFLDEIPKVPNSAYSDLIYDDVFHKDSSPSLYGSSPTNGGIGGMGIGLGRPDRILVPMFQQPGGLANFLDLVRDRQVCLENVIVQDPITLCLKGSVRVRNLDFHKSVHVRYTMDCWRTFNDVQALYVNGSCDGFSDKFTFMLYCHTLRVGQRLEMAVRFQCKGVQYWDNNAGINYCFQCLPMTTNNSYLGIGAGGVSHDWAPAFY
ncbi:glycogen-binding subunit 76A isoform X2 [Fopius arisanus]|uniref:Glycogen-binding subunit 76A isoform X2 n=1 Tax=Fopius arisanus TaxID=64838 RepID=A0A9R1TR22_9HYME|nr:PREDICTED: glycogen-binding subunit 76A-like isoform X2 [Fopius arisanus]